VRPLRQLLRPNSGHPQALGEHVVVHHRFPDRERSQPAGIWPAAASHGRGTQLRVPISFQGPSSKDASSISVLLLEEFVKCVKNH
jgi:hypothetical protein